MTASHPDLVPHVRRGCAAPARGSNARCAKHERSRRLHCDLVPLDLDLYRKRIGYAGPLTSSADHAPSLELLRSLHRAHATTVPFENLDIHLGREISIEEDAVFEKLVVQKRGGYCYEQNTLFLAVLRALGFRVRPLAARVLVNATGPRPRSHMLLLVDLAEDGRWIADVGFGANNLLEPVPFVPGETTEILGEAFRIADLGEGRFRLQTIEASAPNDGSVARDLYEFTLEENGPVDYALMNWWSSTHPTSLFTNTKIVSLPTNPSADGAPGARYVLIDRELRVRKGGVTETTVLEDDAGFHEVLRTRFALDLPEGAVLRWPKRP
jgi:N-hydroxyarylamine O-acetyltransferase